MALTIKNNLKLDPATLLLVIIDRHSLLLIAMVDMENVLVVGDKFQDEQWRLATPKQITAIGSQEDSFLGVHSIDFIDNETTIVVPLTPSGEKSSEILVELCQAGYEPKDLWRLLYETPIKGADWYGFSEKMKTAESSLKG